MFRLLFISLLFPSALALNVPSITLKNAAVPGIAMQAMGIGTFGYASHPGQKAEYWNNSVTATAVAAWLKAGGRRIDTAYDYRGEAGVGMAVLHQTEVHRSEIFITSKVGGLPPGYNDTLEQFEEILTQMNLTYVDLLLIHWPGPLPLKSSDPKCKLVSGSDKECRQSSWLALEKIFKSGGAKAIGVSNFEQNHIQDILDLKSLVPSVNQIEYHPYWHEDGLVEFCQNHSIAVNSYAPLGTPDWGPDHRGWNSTILDLPVVKEIAKAHSKSPAQILLRWAWQKNILLNPRTWNDDHMAENLNIFDFELSDDEWKQIASVPKPAIPKVCPDPHLIKVMKGRSDGMGFGRAVCNIRSYSAAQRTR